MSKYFLIPIIAFLIGIFCVPVQAEEVPSSVSDCINGLNEMYVVDLSAMSYQEYLDRYRACYIEQGYADLLPANMRAEMIVSPLADCLLQAQRINDGSLDLFKQAARVCYEQHSFGGIWDTPELKKLLIEQFDSLTVLSPENANHLGSCLEKITLDATPNAAVQREIAMCFGQVGLTSTAKLYGGVATVIDCAEEVTKTSGNILNATPLTVDQQTSLETCVVTRLAPVTLGLSAVAIPLVAGWHSVLALGQLFFTQLFLFFRKKPATVGRVFDATTHEPVDLSIVRLLTADKKVFKTVVTDKTGEYFFLPPPGIYQVEVVKPAYVFPSQLAIDLPKSSHYFGEALSIVQARDAVNKHIPLDPVEPKASSTSYQLQLWRNRFFAGVAVLGPILSLLSFVVIPALSTLLITLIHLVLYAAFWRVTSKPKRQYGIVKDASGKPLQGVAVSLIETKFSRRIHYTMTDLIGRYYIPSVVGSYTLTFSKPGLTTRTLGLLVGEKERNNGGQHQTVAMTKAEVR